MNKLSLEPQTHRIAGHSKRVAPALRKLERTVSAGLLLLVASGFFAEPKPLGSLNRQAASSFARLALGCVEKEYPGKMDHIMTSAADVQGPQALHPSFYGCFDWHSCVHGHWMLARLLRLFPDLPEAPAIRRVFDLNLQPEKLRPK